MCIIGKLFCFSDLIEGLFEIGFHVGQVDNSLSSFRWVTIVHVVICACGAIGKEFLLSTSRYTKCFMCVLYSRGMKQNH
ncbi:unnamed protein product [Sphagnum jensenii]